MSGTQRATIVSTQRSLLEAMCGHRQAIIEAIGRRALAPYDTLASVMRTNYTPAAPYLTDSSHVPDGGVFGRALQTIARIAKANLANPLRVATIDVGGGYDTHDNQGTVDWSSNDRFPRLITNLSNNLKAFCDDLEADPQWRGRFTIIVVSEFGRVLYQNDSAGTDHGAGNIMLVIGSGARFGVGNVRAGTYGEWPGLTHFGFNHGLQITTDYRRVIADVLTARMGVSKDLINQVIFPGLNYTSGLGIAVPRT